VVDKVGDRVRCHSIIVGKSRSVQVGLSSSSFLQASDWGNALVTECVAGCMSSRFTCSWGDVANNGVGDDGRWMHRYSMSFAEYS